LESEVTDDQKFKDPELAINRVYTRKGDAGMTRLVGGQKVSKTEGRIDAYGTVDELNANVGAAIVAADAEGASALDKLVETLIRVQHDLFNLGSILACLPEDVMPQMPKVGAADIAALEASIDRFNEELAPLRSFVLPGGSSLSAELHRCRTVCRRAERLVIALSADAEVDPNAIAYLNRLSDAFFVWGRAGLALTGKPEVLWDPNRGSSA
jgi:cob(I)alamin adenosyltransferase